MLATLVFIATLSGFAMAGDAWSATSAPDRHQRPWAQQWMLRAIVQRAILVEITDSLALPRPRKVPLRSSFASWRAYGRECRRIALFWRDVAIPVLSGIDRR